MLLRSELFKTNSKKTGTIEVLTEHILHSKSEEIKPIKNIEDSTTSRAVGIVQINNYYTSWNGKHLSSAVTNLGSDYNYLLCKY